MNADDTKRTTEQIWRDLKQQLRRFVSTRMRNPADVDDVLQTIFLRIHTNLANLRNSERIEPWIFRIARNSIADHFRHNRIDVEAEFFDAVADESPSVDLVPTERGSQLAACLAEMIAKLPEEQGRAVTQFEFEGKSHQDIAEQESLSVSGIKSRVQRGRQALRAMMHACCTIGLDRRGNVLDFGARDCNCG